MARAHHVSCIARISEIVENKNEKFEYKKKMVKCQYLLSHFLK